MNLRKNWDLTLSATGGGAILTIPTSTTPRKLKFGIQVYFNHTKRNLRKNYDLTLSATGGGEFYPYPLLHHIGI